MSVSQNVLFIPWGPQTSGHYFDISWKKFCPACDGVNKSRQISPTSLLKYISIYCWFIQPTIFPFCDPDGGGNYGLPTSHILEYSYVYLSLLNVFKGPNNTDMYLYFVLSNIFSRCIHRLLRRL